jgi:hypothetical protein
VTGPSETVILENRFARVGLLPGRGADVCEFTHKRSGTDVVPAWHEEEYRGGWQEVLPNGGPPSVFEGADYGQHGEVCGLPWDAEVEPAADGTVTGRFHAELTRSPLMIEKVLSLDADSATLRVDELVVNPGAAPQRAMWGQHLAFGPPFVGPGDRIEIAEGARVIPHADPLPGGRRVASDREHRWPLATGPDGVPVDLSEVPPAGAPTEMLYLTDMQEGRYVVANGDGVRLTVEWDLEVFPYLWIWQELGATAGRPWFGQAYFIGLEPFSSYPSEGLPAAVANGTALTIAPESSLRTRWSVAIEHAGAA